MMIRASYLALGLSAMVAGGCSNAKCGPGTQRAMVAGGDVECVAVTVAAGTTQCDADAGVGLVDGNKCVSTLMCGPGTKLDVASQKCLPVAQMAHQPQPCAPPSGMNICVNGTVRNLVDGSFLSGQSVKLSFYDPQSFAFSPSGVTPITTLDNVTDTYMVPSIPTPGFLLVVVEDSAGMYQAVGAATTISGDGEVVRLDAWALTKAQYSAWNLPSNMLGEGPLFYRFFNDPAPPPQDKEPTETHPIANVTINVTPNTNTTMRYFGASLAATDATATKTGASGGVVVSYPLGASPLTDRPRVIGGTGGSITWETGKMGLSIPNIVQVDFMHPMQ